MNKAEIIYHYSDGTASLEEESSSTKRVNRIRTVGFSLTDFQKYQLMSSNEKVAYLLENNDFRIN